MPPPWVLATAGYFLAFVVVTWPLAARFTHATYGGPGDGWALIWQTRYRFDHGISYFSPTFSKDLGWPVGAGLSSSLLLSNAAVELPNFLLLAIGIPDVVAYNIITLAAALTSSLAMYALLRRVGCRPTVAFWGGLAYMITPWHLVKLGIHPTLASMAALPLLILGIVEWLDRPSFKSGALVVCAAALGTYTHSYYGLGVAAVLAASVPVVFVIAARRGTLKRMATRTAMLAGALLLVPLPLAFALKGQSSSVSPLLDRPLYLLQYAAHLYLLLLPSVDNPVFGGLSRSWITSHSRPLNEGELSLYIGWLTLVLAGAGLILAWRRRALRSVAAVAATTAFAGLLLMLPGLEVVPHLGTIRMPIAYVDDVVKFVSTPARFFAFTLTGVVALAGVGLELIVRPLARRWAVVAVGGACCFSFLELPYFGEGRVFDTQPPRVVDAIRSTVPPGEPIAQYPSMENFYPPMENQLFFMRNQGHPLVNGAPATSSEDAVRVAVEDQRSPQTPAILALIGVRWATYEPYAQAVKQQLIGPATAEQPYAYTPPHGFKVVRHLVDGALVMLVTARPAPAFAATAEGFSREGFSLNARWLMGRTGKLLACATTGGEYTFRFRSGAYGVPHRIRIGNSPVIEIGANREQKVRARVPLRAGWQLLRIRVVDSRPLSPTYVVLPGQPPSEPLTVLVGTIAVDGPRGSADPCRSAPPLSEIPTVG